MNAGRKHLIVVTLGIVAVALGIVLALVNWGGAWGVATFSAGFGNSPSITIQPGGKPQLKMDGGVGPAATPTATQPSDEVSKKLTLILDGQNVIKAELAKQDGRITRLEERLASPPAPIPAVAAAPAPTACPEGCYQTEHVYEARRR